MPSKIQPKLNLPVITISYYGHHRPKITLPAGLRNQVEIKFTDLMEKDFLALEHASVKVYYSYKEECAGSVDTWATGWFAPERWTHWESDTAFHEDDLPGIPQKQVTRYSKLYPKSPTRQKLAYAIDQGWISTDGFYNPEQSTAPTSAKVRVRNRAAVRRKSTPATQPDNNL